MKAKIIILKKFMSGTKDDKYYYIAQHKCEHSLGITWQKDYNKKWTTTNHYRFCPYCGKEIPSSNEIEKQYIRQTIEEFIQSYPESIANNLLLEIKGSSLLAE
jgi:hypothetical protein